MKTKVITFLGLVLVGILFATLAPANMKDKLVGIAKFATDERRCFNFHKDDFIDPDSAYVAGSYIWTKQDELATGTEYPNPAFDKYDAILNVAVFGKNRMGGYVKEYVACPLINGSFDSHEAFMYKLSPKGAELLAAPAAEIPDTDPTYQ